MLFHSISDRTALSRKLSGSVIHLQLFMLLIGMPTTFRFFFSLYYHLILVAILNVYATLSCLLNLVDICKGIFFLKQRR